MPLRAIETADPKAAAEIEAALLADLRQRAPQGRNEPITLSVRAADGSRIAGLSGATSYGWLLIKVLWVAQGFRRQGYGRALVAEALGRAEALECHGAWLDTSDQQAYQFYQSLGFQAFGTLKNQGVQTPQDHQRWFLRRAIP